MAQKTPDFQPGLILLDVLVGAFRAKGTSFEAWCKSKRYSSMNVRNAALGGSRTPTVRKMLDEAIEAAGRDFVMTAYRQRVGEHWAQLQKGAA